MTTSKYLIAIITLLFFPLLCFAMDADNECTKARIFFEKGDFENALVHYENALKVRPGSAPIKLNKAITQYRAGLYKEVLASIGSIEADTNKPDILSQAWTLAGNANVKLSESAQTSGEAPGDLIKKALVFYNKAIQTGNAAENVYHNKAYARKLLEKMRENKNKRNTRNQEPQKKNSARQTRGDENTPDSNAGESVQEALEKQRQANQEYEKGNQGAGSTQDDAIEATKQALDDESAAADKQTAEALKQALEHQRKANAAGIKDDTENAVSEGRAAVEALEKAAESVNNNQNGDKAFNRAQTIIDEEERLKQKREMESQKQGRGFGVERDW